MCPQKINKAHTGPEKEKKMNKKQTIEALKKAGYQVKPNVFARERIEACNGSERVDVFFGRRTRNGKQAESAVFYCIPIFQPSGTHKSSRGSGMDECEIIPGLRAKEHRAAKRFSTAFPKLIVRECGVATTCFKAGKVLSR